MQQVALKDDSEGCILQKWVCALQANAVSDKILDLRMCDFTGKNLSGKVLSGALLKDATLPNSILRETVLTKVSVPSTGRPAAFCG